MDKYIRVLTVTDIYGNCKGTGKYFQSLNSLGDKDTGVENSPGIFVLLRAESVRFWGEASMK